MVDKVVSEATEGGDSPSPGADKPAGDADVGSGGGGDAGIASVASRQPAEQRDHDAELRDRAAEKRDRAAEFSEALGAAGTSDGTLSRSALARRDAASDRWRASQDRAAGAAEREHASMDGLTGVYMRAAGFVQLEREMARARRSRQPLALAFVDVDGLKAVNDSRGHAAGDRLLVDVAKTLGAHLRSYDLIIRYGGDEFLCAVSGLDADQTFERITSVNAALADSGERGSVTVGVAELQPDDSLEELIRRADTCLYRERQQRRSRQPATGPG
ncbi:MAG TPA: GGDEF domain-containing protein [Acidimicrobiales bacterium]|nr:GGDEF domain-containing protein [Acidimicrobiales bacterium]